MGTLTHLTIATTGTLPHPPSRLRHWITANGALYSPSVTASTTHLIAGADAWRRSSAAVQAATAHGAFVVSYDWLEDSLQRKRKLAEKKYSWEVKARERKMRRRMERADGERFERGCLEAREATGKGMSLSMSKSKSRAKQSKSFFFGEEANVPFASTAEELKRRREEREAAKAKRADAEAVKKTEPVSPLPPASPHATSTPPGRQAKTISLQDLYHYFLDITGFEYKIVLSRANLRANAIAIYKLSILESHAKPHVYCTFVEYLPPSDGGAPSEGGACVQALLDFNAAFQSDDSTPPSPLSHQHTIHPEAHRLTTLLTPPPPLPSKPHKSLLTPLSTPFPTAFLAFRHAFLDLTLLSWEERFDSHHALTKTRAAALGIEPFVYVRPRVGMPRGLRVQGGGVGVGVLGALGALVREGETDEDGEGEGEGGIVAAAGGGGEKYTYNAFNLPALSHPLGDGVVGNALRNDAEAALKQAERRAEAAEEVRMKAEGLTGKKDGLARKKGGTAKPNYSGRCLMASRASEGGCLGEVEGYRDCGFWG